MHKNFIQNLYRFYQQLSFLNFSEETTTGRGFAIQGFTETTVKTWRILHFSFRRNMFVCFVGWCTLNSQLFVTLS